MTAHQVFTLGLVVGLFVAALVVLSVFVRYVESDLGSFRKWLDMEAGAP